MTRPKLALDMALSLGLSLLARAAGTLVFILLSWLRGGPEAGTFTLALGYLAVLTTIFLGLDDLLVREVARQPKKVWSILVTYGALRCGLSLVAWVGLALIVRLLPAYSASDLVVLMVVAASILPDTITALVQATMNAQHEYAWPLVAGLASCAIKLLAAGWFLMQGFGLEVMAWAWPLGSAAGAILLGFVLVWYQPGLRPLADLWRRADASRYLRLLPAFGGASLVAALEGQLDIILLSILAARARVAEYSAAATILMGVLVLSQAFRAVLYPRLVRSLATSPAQTRRLLRRALVLMGSLAVLLAAIVSALAPWLVDVIFQDRYELSGMVLRILIWCAVFYFLNVPLARFLLAADGQAVLLRVLLVSLAANLIANLVLIPSLGVLGPAWARLISSGVFTALTGAQVYVVLRRPMTVPAV